ncbi:hypothetical protein ACWT_2608 [Actinoplanes sp. SE50]|nr:hypothetical protein ACPL_2938 [Actinoplanes sp. SE50/110]ATO82023.1 hypothetical protein ACWT_2608 [Actinoplanes sp. SE50]SLL99431.1 hypothetical protein ACSP50_2662 [Actinoplanes sp. SE50/110]
MIAMFLAVLIGSTIAALAVTFWPQRHGGPSGLFAGPGPATGPGPLSAVLLPVATVIPPMPESTEGILIAQLMRGELSAEQYRHAMSGIAAREEGHSPMPLPGALPD